MPSLTVVIPAFNAASTLDETLSSLAKQSWADWEAIIVNDGSTDATLELARSWCARDSRVSVFDGPNRGVSAARNEGARSATAPWLLFLDADDTIAPTFVEDMLRMAGKERSIDVVYCDYAKFVDSGRIGYPVTAPDIVDFPLLAVRNVLQTNSCILRRRCFEEADGFDEELGTCSDWDFWQRLARMGARFAPARACLALYRLRANSISQNVTRLFRAGCLVAARGHGPDPRVERPAPEYAAGQPIVGLDAARAIAAAWGAAMLVGRGTDPREFLADAGIRSAPRLRVDDIASCVQGGVPQGACRLEEDWPYLWSACRSSIKIVLDYFGLVSGREGFVDECWDELLRRISWFPGWANRLDAEERPRSPIILSTLFKSSNLCARHDARFGGERVMVTFSDWKPKPDPEDEGWQQRFLARLETDAIHVVSGTNAWFQYPEMDEVLAAVSRACAAYSEVIVGGVSMGAYQAIRAASRLGARRVVALSPQYSIDPAKVPFETRWKHEASAVSSFTEAAVEDAENCIYYVIYDNRDEIDSRHVALLAERIAGLCRVPVPFSSHDTAFHLAECGLLEFTLAQIIAGRFDRQAFRRRLRGKRGESPIYLTSLARAPRLNGCMDELVQRALVVGGHRSSTLTRVADAYASVGNWRAASEAMLAAARAASDDARLHHMAGYYLAMAGDLPQSAAEERRAAELRSDWFDPLQGLAYTLEKIGDIEGAIAAAERAVAIQPDEHLSDLRSRLRATGPAKS